MARFSLMAESCIGFRGQHLTFKDSGHRLEAFLSCERIDGYRFGDTSSDRSSIDRSVDFKSRTFDRRQSREISPSSVFPTLVGIPPVGSSRVFSTEKSIIDQFRINSETSVSGELARSQQRSNQHIPFQPYPHQQPLHFNQQPAHQMLSPHSRLLLPPSSPRSLSSLVFSILPIIIMLPILIVLSATRT